MSYYRFLMLPALAVVLASCAEGSEDEVCSTENVVDDGETANARQALARSNKALVTQALHELFDNEDLTAIDRYWADARLPQTPQATGGLASFRDFARQALSRPRFAFEVLHAVADGDLVAIHGRYLGFEEPQSAVIVFRVRTGRITEHWGGLQPVMATQVSRATPEHARLAPPALTLTDTRRALVRDFVETLLVDGDTHAARKLLGGTGVLPGAELDYRRVRRVIAEDDLVLTETAGEIATEPHAFFDLFRLERNQIVEHWRVAQATPTAASSPGLL